MEHISLSYIPIWPFTHKKHKITNVFCPFTIPPFWVISFYIFFFLSRFFCTQEISSLNFLVLCLLSIECARVEVQRVAYNANRNNNIIDTKRQWKSRNYKKEQIKTKKSNNLRMMKLRITPNAIRFLDWFPRLFAFSQ